MGKGLDRAAPPVTEVTARQGQRLKPLPHVIPTEAIAQQSRSGGICFSMHGPKSGSLDFGGYAAFARDDLELNSLRSE